MQWEPSKGATRAEIDTAVEAVIAEATLDEKVGMMSGRGFFAAFKEDGGLWGARPYRAGGGIERLAIEPFYFTDGPRGVARGQSTCFPCTMARGASFDTDLEMRIGEAMAKEARAQGCNLSGAVCINLLRHPAWGRAQETYGEDSYHLGAMGVALATGLQAHNVCATAKHFALNSMENARFKVDVRVDERALHEIYLPHFKACVDAGIGSIMSAYNKANGEYCGQDRRLLTDILRGEWEFEGFVHSDWIMGVYEPYAAAAGLDVENPEPRVFGKNLIAAVEAGQVEPHAVDTACRRILRTYFRFKTAQSPLPHYPMSLVACDAHRALACEAAEKSAVLLENNGVLPLDRARIARLAVLGRLAALENTGDNGSSKVRPPYVVSPLVGLLAMLGEDRIVAADESDLDGAHEAAESADAVVVVAGYTAREEGEFIPGGFTLGTEGTGAAESIGGDRLDLGLPADQVALIDVAARSGKPVIVVIVAGSAVLVEEWHEQVSAILQTFYAGMEGGHALARLLFGEVSPSGRLPLTVARDPAHYPEFDRNADEIEYGYWHGYATFAEDGVAPRYPFGHGLSYTSFDYRALTARVRGEAIEISVAVRNEGDVAAEDVLLVWLGFPGTVSPRAKRALKAFGRVRLDPGEGKTVRLSIPLDGVRYRDASTHGWKLESGAHRIIVARDALAEPLLETTVAL